MLKTQSDQQNPSKMASSAKAFQSAEFLAHEICCSRVSCLVAWSLISLALPGTLRGQIVITVPATGLHRQDDVLLCVAGCNFVAGQAVIYHGPSNL